MAYAVTSPTSYIFHGNSVSKNSSQLDLRFFTDFHTPYSTAGLLTEGANFIHASANGGGISVQSAAIHSDFGITFGSGVMGFSTGTTSNSAGNCSVYTASHIVGIPTPSNGTVVKYECELLMKTVSSTGIPDSAANGFYRFGFMDSQNQLSPGNGVYFEYMYDGSKTDTTWYLSFMNSFEERVDTTMTVASGKIYRLYLSVERNSSGTFTTTYNIKNITDNTTVSGTAAPSTTARYPSSETASFMYPAFVVSKTGTATTTTKQVYLDYFAARIQKPVDREILLLS